MNRKFCATLAALAIVLCASSAFAGLFMDLKAVPGVGYEISADGKTVTLLPGIDTALVTMEIFGTISGVDAILTNERYTMVSGGFKQVGRVEGNTSALSLPTDPVKGYLAPYDSLANSAVTITDLLIGKEGATTATGAWAARTATPVYTVASPETYALGLINLTVRSDGLIGPTGLITTVNYVKPGTGIGAYTLTFDGAAGNAAGISVGAPVNVQVIPEPSTLILLGMGALALVFIRRRK